LAHQNKKPLRGKNLVRANFCLEPVFILLFESFLVEGGREKPEGAGVDAGTPAP